MGATSSWLGSWTHQLRLIGEHHDHDHNHDHADGREKSADDDDSGSVVTRTWMFWCWGGLDMISDKSPWIWNYNSLSILFVLHHHSSLILRPLSTLKWKRTPGNYISQHTGGPGTFIREPYHWISFSSGSHVAVEFIKQSHDCSYVKVQNMLMITITIINYNQNDDYDDHQRYLWWRSSPGNAPALPCWRRWSFWACANLLHQSSATSSF